MGQNRYRLREAVRRAAREEITSRAVVVFAYKKCAILSTMTTMTIPKTFRGSDDLIVLPRKEYEALKARVIPEYTPTATERRMITRARARMQKNRTMGKLLTLDELKRKLASRN